MENVKYKGYDIVISQDENYDSPAEWGNTDIFLVGYHRDFWVESKIITKDTAIKIGEGISDDETQAITSKYYTFLLYAYIHSGVSLSLGRSAYPFNDAWDSSCLGLVLVEKTQAKDEKQAKELALGLVKTWNQSLSGQVYGYNIDDEETGENIGSCWGYYGDIQESGLLESAKDEIDYYIKNTKKQAVEKAKDYSKKTLGELLSSSDITIKRNAISILKTLQK
jgi:hypothetical protein